MAKPEGKVLCQGGIEGAIPLFFGFYPSSFLLLVVRPGATSSFLLLVAMPLFLVAIYS